MSAWRGRRRYGRSAVLSLALAGAPLSGVAGQQLTGVRPDVVSAGALPVTVTLRGRALGSVREVRFQDCTGDTARVPLGGAAARTVQVPRAMLRGPCVLRVRIPDQMTEIPLAVADPATLSLSVSAPDPDAVHPWRGQFNARCEEDTGDLPLLESEVALSSDSPLSGTFVVGKNRHALMRVAMRPPARRAPDSSEACVYLVLPGVAPEDVQWGPRDVEGFWIGVLDPGGRTIHDVQFRSDLVPE